mmetsp:Transcript_33191/g.50864  ORF Transcript_33191/g.50864 Transcript_33191/m.50864 type:complete len:111 (-) Transcript_33191:718-1050(-)
MNLFNFEVWLPYSQHEVIETDYDNFAITYACTDWFRGIFHSQTASLLSRREVLEEVYVKAAKNFMDNSYSYNTDLFWGKELNLMCKYGSIRTQDQDLIDFLGTTPNWADY